MLPSPSRESRAHGVTDRTASAALQTAPGCFPGAVFHVVIIARTADGVRPFRASAVVNALRALSSRPPWDSGSCSSVYFNRTIRVVVDSP